MFVFFEIFLFRLDIAHWLIPPIWYVKSFFFSLRRIFHSDFIKQFYGNVILLLLCGSNWLNCRCGFLFWWIYFNYLTYMQFIFLKQKNVSFVLFIQSKFAYCPCQLAAFCYFFVLRGFILIFFFLCVIHFSWWWRCYINNRLLLWSKRWNSLHLELCLIEFSVWILCFVLLQVMLGSYCEMRYYCDLCLCWAS